MKTAPTATLEALLNLTPLPVYMEGEVEANTLRIMERNQCLDLKYKCLLPLTHLVGKL